MRHRIRAKEMETVKKFLAILLLVFYMPYSVSAEEISQRNVTLSLGRLLSCGYSIYEANKLLDKWEQGEPLTPFQIPDYDVYNSPAEENGHYGDLLLLTGTIKEYVKTGDSSTYVIGVRLVQDDGHEWMISCALYKEQNLIGGMRGVAEETVFDGFEGDIVEIYGVYTGFSEKFKLPAVDIVTYGGMYVTEEDLFISTLTATLEMQKDKIFDLGYLIGAKRSQKSNERYMP